MNKIKIKNLKKSEKQAIDLMEKIWKQTDDKKLLVRVISFIIIAIAVFQELFTEEALSSNWLEITIYMLMGYFGAATYRNTFKIK